MVHLHRPRYQRQATLYLMIQGSFKNTSLAKCNFVILFTCLVIRETLLNVIGSRLGGVCIN